MGAASSLEISGAGVYETVMFTDSRAEAAASPRPSWWQRFMLGMVTRTFGKPPMPMRIMARVPRVFMAYSMFEAIFSKSATAPMRLKVLAGQRVASLVGCPW